MILCLCEGVSDRAVRQAVRDGASTVREIGCRTRAGTSCGACACDLRKVLRDTLAEMAAEHASPAAEMHHPQPLAAK